MDIFDLPRDQFNGLMSEMDGAGRDTSDLRREYGRANSIFSGIYDWADQTQQDLADEGRRSVGGLLSKDQGTTGMDALRSTRFEPSAFVSGLLGGVAEGFDAPAQAARGDIPPEDMANRALGTAGMATLGAGAMTAPAGALRSGAARSVEEIAAARLAAPAKNPEFYHPASRVKLQQPLSEILPQLERPEAPEGFLQPQRTLDLEDLEGEVLAPAFWDRTATGGLLTRVLGEELSEPVPLQGGADFMRSPGGVAASVPDAMDRKARALEEIADAAGQEPLLAYTAMGAQAGDFSKMMSGAVMGQLRPSRRNSIEPEVVSLYDDFVRDKVDPNWPGILSPNAGEYVDGMTGSNRRLLWQEMGKGEYAKAGFPDIGAIRLAITDPRLIDAQPFDTGLTVSRMNQGFEVTPTPSDVHQTYGGRMSGEYVGGLSQQIPGELVWRDFFNARRAANTRPADDQRAFMMTPSVNQKFTGQQIEDIQRYLRLIGQ